MSPMFLVLILVVAASVTSPIAEPEPVEVTVYYETLLHDCKSFILNQLVPTFVDKSWRQLIRNLTLVPYGWVMVVDADNHEYACQNGNAECEGNMLQACATKHIEGGADKWLPYIYCTEQLNINNSQLHFPLDQCQDYVSDKEYSDIMNCFNSDERWQLFAKNGKLSHDFFAGNATGFIPYVSFNNEGNDDLALTSLNDFRNALCSVTGWTAPPCS